MGNAKIFFLIGRHFSTLNKFDKSYDDCNKKEQQLLSLLFNKFNNVQSVKKSSCEHQQLINQIQDALAKNPHLKHNKELIKTLYKNLQSMFNMSEYIVPNKDGSNINDQMLISCSNCSTKLLCSHYITILKLIIDNKKYKL